MEIETNHQKKNTSLHSEHDPINVNQNEKKALINPDAFSYLIPSSSNPFIFTHEMKDYTSLSAVIKNQYRFLINIIVDNDTNSNDIRLKRTLEAIIRNLPSLEPLGLTTSNILISIFVNQVSPYFIEKTKIVLEDSADYLITPYTFGNNDNIENKTLNVLLITKQNYLLSDLNDIIFFYNAIMPYAFIPIKHSVLYTCSMRCGIILTETSLKQMITSSYKDMNKGCVCVAPIQALSATGIFGKIMTYEHVHYNIYDMNYYDAAGLIPIDHRFNVMRIDANMYNLLINFYKSPNVFVNTSLEYSDYALGAWLRNNQILVKYVDCVDVYIDYNGDVDYSMYMDNYTRKYGGNFAGLKELVKSFMNCKGCSASAKFFQFFVIIGTLFEFIQPSLMCMVLYTIFFEGFKIVFKPEPAVFFTGLFGLMLILSGAVSMISSYPQQNRRINFVFYIIYEVFYLFILCLSICAMHFVKQNKTNDPYEFNKGAIISMIIINFILGILPIIFNISKIKPNIVNMLLYMILGASSSSSHFQMCYLFNFSDMYGGYSTEEHQMKQKLNMKERKSISLFALFAFNILFGFLTMLNNTRTRRVRTVQAFGIIFTVYNGMKVIGILLRMLTQGRNNLNDMNNVQKQNVLKQEIEGGTNVENAPAHVKAKIEDDENNRKNESNKNHEDEPTSERYYNERRQTTENKDKEVHHSENDIGFDDEEEDDKNKKKEEHPDEVIEIKFDDNKEEDVKEAPKEIKKKKTESDDWEKDSEHHNKGNDNNNSGAFISPEVDIEI